MGRITDTVKVLLIVNILFYVGSMAIGEEAYRLFALWFPQSDNFQVWQLVTHMFMHSREMFTHIMFNMFMLYMFGSNLENAIGKNKFIFLYFSAGLGAAGLQILFTYWQYVPALNAHLEAGVPMEQIRQLFERLKTSETFYPFQNVDIEATRQLLRAYGTPMVGASGAISGVLVAFAVVFPNLPLYLMFIPVPIKAKYLVGGYFLLDLYGGITGNAIIGPSNVAHWAHVGGGIIGFITMWYWKKNSFNKNRWDR